MLFVLTQAYTRLTRYEITQDCGADGVGSPTPAFNMLRVIGRYFA